jgi:DNA-binding MltR family transcriptional regulator
MSDSQGGGKGLVVASSVAITQGTATMIEAYLGNVRARWSEGRFIETVRKLMEVDRGSACQKLLNVAFQDLREKVQIAGMDLALEATKQHSLPPCKTLEDLEHYPRLKLIELVWRMGLVSRPVYRRLRRAYDIRHDLEHEDQEYEVTPEDILYVFATSVRDVLSQDPIEVLRVDEVVEAIEKPVPATVSTKFVTDYEHAHDVRQLEILKMLVARALNPRDPEIVRDNAELVLRTLAPKTKHHTQVDRGKFFMERLQKRPLTAEIAEVAYIAGVLPYVPENVRIDYYEAILSELKKAGHGFRSHGEHPGILSKLVDIGGLHACPATVRQEIVLWLVRAYIGEPGGYGQFGRNRRVFYSNSAEVYVVLFLKGATASLAQDFHQVCNHQDVAESCENEHVGARLIDLKGTVVGS